MVWVLLKVREGKKRKLCEPCEEERVRDVRGKREKRSAAALFSPIGFGVQGQAKSERVENRRKHTCEDDDEITSQSAGNSVRDKSLRSCMD